MFARFNNFHLLYDVLNEQGNFVKKVRINLSKEAESWSFVLYDSSESAFYLKDENLQGYDDEFYRTVTLLPREVMEVEWLGSEYVFSDEFGSVANKPYKLQHDRFDKVRLCKLTMNPRAIGKTSYVELHSGWVRGDTFRWASCSSRAGIRITRIKGRVVSKLDFEKLFVGQDLSEEDKEFEEEFKAEDFVN
jgi:hypothetical protein